MASTYVTCIIGKRNSARFIPVLLFAIILLSTVPLSVSGSTPPLQPLVAVAVANRTISPGNGIDVSVEYIENGVIYPIPPDKMEISLYKIPDGSLLGTYTIPQTGVRDGGAIHLYSGTIPGPILAEGDVMLVASDPVSGADSRVAVRILAAGELYQGYRNLQVMESMFYPAAAGIIVVLLIVLGILVAKRT